MVKLSRGSKLPIQPFIVTASFPVQISKNPKRQAMCTNEKEQKTIRSLVWEGINAPRRSAWRGRKVTVQCPEQAGRVWGLRRGREQLLKVLWEVNKGSGLWFTLSPQDRVQSRQGERPGTGGRLPRAGQRWQLGRARALLFTRG